ncbi:MDR family MFS transporter [Furfurilactobacillus siliginis]|uniref:EmrB QacA subfamily drug resistance transporter n=1 Tax=Furfurilactobacillus siliginis TaxID=348151 RepID=A0A0R2L1E2_9LACO|nr:MDR family MFS transporter [Furfurilactobacillus siliginis]KRN93670.1 EmrB QacA subfamily drug resistance transporter [Furfurilactobacillus siliginis]GEK28374.1 MFS transporter [Furfurilactobacillus siliginis]
MKVHAKTNVALVTAAIFVATFMSAVEGTIVSTAMPTIVGDLHGVILMNWVFSIYLLTNSLATPIYGKLADRIGRKPVFLFGLAVFVFGSVMSGLSNTMLTLILWRAVQGIGAGTIMPVSFTIIADIYPFEKRAQVMGLNGAAWGIASVVAPLIGGFIVDQLSWHWVFFINAPIGLLAMLMIIIFLHEPKQAPATSPLDLAGSVWLTVTLVGLMYGFQVLGESNRNWMIIGVCFVITVIGLLGFIRQERRAADPIIDLNLFKQRTFIIQNGVAALISGFLICFNVYIPTWTQGLLGLKAAEAGFAVTPSSVMWIVGSFIAGRLIGKFSPRQIIMISTGIVLVGAAILVLLPANTAFWVFLLVSAELGVGFGLTITSTTVTVQHLVDPAHIGMATSFNTLSRSLSQTLMLAIFGIMMNTSLVHGVAAHAHTNMGMVNALINPQTATRLPHNVLPALRATLASGVHNVFLVALVLVIGAVGLNLLDSKGE